jgi:hypothetical protein
MPSRASEATEGSKNVSWPEKYERWLFAEDPDKAVIERDLEATWRKTWAKGNKEEKCDVLLFLGRAGIKEGQETIWQSLNSSEEEIRDMALEACMMSFARGWNVREANVRAIWSYFENYQSFRRMLALILLDKIGALTQFDRLSQIAANDPDESIRAEASGILRSQRNS